MAHHDPTPLLGSKQAPPSTPQAPVDPMEVDNRPYWSVGRRKQALVDALAAQTAAVQRYEGACVRCKELEEPVCDALADLSRQVAFLDKEDPEALPRKLGYMDPNEMHELEIKEHSWVAFDRGMEAVGNRHHLKNPPVVLAALFQRLDALLQERLPVAGELEESWKAVVAARTRVSEEKGLLWKARVRSSQEALARARWRVVTGGTAAVGLAAAATMVFFGPPMPPIGGPGEPLRFPWLVDNWYWMAGGLLGVALLAGSLFVIGMRGRRKRGPKTEPKDPGTPS